MPFGINKSLGGDNKSNDAWMERCVSKVEKSGKDKSSAIAICKAQMRKMKDSKAEFEEVDPQILQEFSMRKQERIKHLMQAGKTYAQAQAEFNKQLELSDYNF